MLAILTTHPIQYQVPIWKALAERGRVPFKVYYMSDQGLAARHDPGFGRSIAWDIDLTSGYNYEFVQGVVTGVEQSSFWWLRLCASFGIRLAGGGSKILWVQGWQVAAYWQAVWQARRARLGTWIRAETNLRSAGDGWSQVIKRPALRQLFDRIDTFLCIGEANRQFYLSRGIDPNKLASAPYCVDNARFARQANALRSERAAIRQRWCIPDSAACVLFVGKFIEKKRPLDLVAAGKLVQERLPDRPLHLLFVGSGELLTELKERCRIAYAAEDEHFTVANAENDGRVTASFVGFLNQSEMAQAYVAADCLVLPSGATETWGLAVNEAMASGLPAVVSDAVGCSDDLIKPKWPDLCFPAGNHARLADALTSCLTRPPSRAELKALIERYDVLCTVETVERLYSATQLRPQVGSRA